MTKKIQILLKKELKKYQAFHAYTKQHSLPRTPLHPRFWPKEWKTTYYKEYPRLDKIVLPKPKPPKKSLFTALSERKSTRGFSKEPLTINQISDLLFYSAGERKNTSPHYSGRFYPSGGARYPLEIYILSRNSELPYGIYHYNVRFHSLEMLSQEKLYFKEIINQKWVFTASILIVITGVFERNIVKYNDRGYRHVLVESGHIAHNFYLNAAAYHVAISGVGGYVDDTLHHMLDVDGIDESVIYVLAIGNF